MRFDYTGGNKATDIIENNSIENLTKIFKKYGEERFSYRIARSIKEMKEMRTVNHLREAIRRCTPPKNRDRIFARIFQSLRIFVYLGSNPLAGSSNKTISGSWINVIAIAIFCLIPLE